MFKITYHKQERCNCCGNTYHNELTLQLDLNGITTRLCKTCATQITSTMSAMIKTL